MGLGIAAEHDGANEGVVLVISSITAIQHILGVPLQDLGCLGTRYQSWSIAVLEYHQLDLRCHPIKALRVLCGVEFLALSRPCLLLFVTVSNVGDGEAILFTKRT